MKADELGHIRADVQQAILEAQQHDPTVTLEILYRLLDWVGEWAVADFNAAWSGNPQGAYYRAVVAENATRLLEDVQLRATSKVPYGETPIDEPPEDHRD